MDDKYLNELMQALGPLYKYPEMEEIEFNPVGTAAELAAARDQITALTAERDQLRKERDDYYNEMMQSALDVLIALRERDEARAMSAAWKRAAKVYRTLYLSPFPFLEAVDSDHAPLATQQVGRLSPLSAAEAWHALTGEHDSVAQGNEQD